MRRSFRLPQLNPGIPKGPAAWLRIGAAVLALLNAVALFFYFVPPGGSKSDLTTQTVELQQRIAATRSSSLRLKAVASKVQLGNNESADFESKYFLPKRLAYEALLAELQRMAAASGMQDRGGAYTEEPIEGTNDLTLLNLTANFEGTYGNLMQFLYQVDKSPMLVMLDTLSAAPLQSGQRLNTSLRFQYIFREDGSGSLGGQP
jgi:Tfp pilus assembly protein PilO